MVESRLYRARDDIICPALQFTGQNVEELVDFLSNWGGCDHKGSRALYEVPEQGRAWMAPYSCTGFQFPYQGQYLTLGRDDWLILEPEGPRIVSRDEFPTVCREEFSKKRGGEKDE